jgi:hypothetical protein
MAVLAADSLGEDGGDGLDAIDARASGFEHAAELDRDWQAIMQVLPAQWQERAWELGAVQRRLRNFPDVPTLLRVLLMHLAEGCSLRQAATRAQQGSLVDVSAVALFKRLRNCAAWFQWMTQQLVERACNLPTQWDMQSRRVRLIDGTTVSEPGASGASWRLHYSFDLQTLACDELHLSDASVGESLVRYQVKPGDIVMADRGYATQRGVAHVVGAGADVVLRMAIGKIALYDQAGQRLDVLALLRSLELAQVGSWEAWIRPQELDRQGQAMPPCPQTRVRVCAYKKTAAQTKAAVVEIEREARRKNTAKVRQQTLEAAGYVIVLTTLQEHSAHAIMELYRRRWQVELAFKRLKSLVQLAHLKKKDAQGAKAWLQGKLLVATLIETLIQTAERVSPWGYALAPVAPAQPVERVRVHGRARTQGLQPSPAPGQCTAQLEAHRSKTA